MPATPTGPTAEVVIAADIDYLRSLIDDKVGDVELPSITQTWTDNELEIVLLRNEWDLYKSASICWGMRAGKYAKLIDANESGSSRLLSQLHNQALAQCDYYMNLALLESEGKFTDTRIVGLVRVRGDGRRNGPLVL